MKQPRYRQIAYAFRAVLVLAEELAGEGYEEIAARIRDPDR